MPSSDAAPSSDSDDAVSDLGTGDIVHPGRSPAAARARAKAARIHLGSSITAAATPTLAYHDGGITGKRIRTRTAKAIEFVSSEDDDGSMQSDGSGHASDATLPDTVIPLTRKRGRPRGGGTASAKMSVRGGRGGSTKRGRRGRGGTYVAPRNLPRRVAVDSCVGLLAADVDPFITERARRKLGSAALREQCTALELESRNAAATDAAGNAARAAEVGVLKLLIEKISPIEATLATLQQELHSLVLDSRPARTATRTAALSAKIAELTEAKDAPDIYDGFENDYAKAFLLLMHNTNLGSCPALGTLRAMTEADRADDPAGLACVLRDCEAEVAAIVHSIRAARPAQLSGYYSTRDPLAPLHSCASCGRREIAEQPPHVRVPLADLVRVFEYESVMAADAFSAAAQKLSHANSSIASRVGAPAWTRQVGSLQTKCSTTMKHRIVAWTPLLLGRHAAFTSTGNSLTST